jgi:zinc protease
LTPLRVEKLPSGVTVLLREARLAPVVEVQVWAGVGSADEGEGEAGLAHFHEHMLFKGTASRGVGEVAGAVEGAGGRINAFTSFDATCYHATLPSAAWPLGLDVLADAVQHSRFEAGEVAREIAVVLEEISRSDDDPHHVLGDAAFSTLFRVHPYRAPVLGTRASVSSFTSEKLLRFYRRWYAPDNLTLVVVGDFDADAVLRAAEAAFADARPSGARHARPAEPPQQGLRLAVLERDFERGALELCWPAVPLRHADAPLLDLLAFVLGEGESSRLDRRVKEERGLADRIDASCYTPLDAGMFGIGADFEPERAAELVEALAREVETLRREPVGEEELEKARRNFLASRAWEQESVTGMARKLGTSQLLTGDPGFEDTYLARIRAATRDDLLRVAREWLVPEQQCLALVAPNGAAPAEASLRAALARGTEAAARRYAAPPRAAAGAPGTHAYTLGAGLRLLVQPRREVSVVSVRAALLGGQLVESEASAGLTRFLSGCWLRGTASHGAAEFAERVDSLAAHLDAFAGRSSCGLTLDCPVESFPAALALFSDALLAPAFAEQEIERERRETLAALARQEDRLAVRAFDLFARTHWERHPYRMPIPGTPETVTRIDRAALLAHHERLARADNLVLAVVGDVDPDETAALVQRRFADLEGGSTVERELPPPEPAPRAVRTAYERKDRAQAHLVIGFRGLDVRDPDRVALEVLCQMLSGQGGRLFLELRDRQGLAYSVGAVDVEGLAPGFFAVSIATAPEKLDDAQGGILAELRRTLDGPPPPAELERARRFLLGSFAIERQRSAARSLQLALDARYGLPIDVDRDYPQQIAAVGAEDVLRVARRIFTLDAYTLAAVGTFVETSKSHPQGTS